MKKPLHLAVLLMMLANCAAVAADLPARKSPVTVSPPSVWSGFYAGLNAGGTWSNNSNINSQTWNLSYPDGQVINGNLVSATLLSGSSNNNANASGFIGGGQIGYNWQANTLNIGSGIVTGIEADIQGIAGTGGTANRWTAAPTDDSANSVSLISNQYGRYNLQYLGTVRGRFGILATPTLLVYGTGGLAYGGVSASVQNTQLWLAPSCGCNYLIVGNGSTSNTQVGWTAGGGMEWIFMPNWSLKTEYLYYDLGNTAGSIVNTNFGFNTAAGDSGIQSVSNYMGRAAGNIVRAGLNYHFNLDSTPVVANYY